MSNEEEADDVGVQDYFFMDDEVDKNLLIQHELILLVKENPALYAKSTKEYCGKGFDKDLAWQTIGSSLTKPLSGLEAFKLFYSIRQRFSRERRKVLVSLKGKSGQGTMAPYVPTWLLYEECMFLADHILARKTSSSYSTNALPKSQMAAAVRPNFEVGRALPTFPQPSPSLPIIRSTPTRLSPSSSPSPSIIRRTFARSSLSPIIRPTSTRPSPLPSSTGFRSIVSPQTSESSSMWNSDNNFSLENVEGDASDNSQSAAGQSLAATAEEISSDVSSPVESIKSIKAAKLKRKRTVPLPDNFALKKKKEDDALAQAIMSQTSVLSSMMTDKNQNISVATSNNVANSSDIGPVISAISFVLQSVPRERHVECMIDVIKMISEKYAKQ